MNQNIEKLIEELQSAILAERNASRNLWHAEEEYGRAKRIFHEAKDRLEEAQKNLHSAITHDIIDSETASLLAKREKAGEA